MAANTAVALMLVGLGLLLLDISLGGRLWPSPVLAGVTGSLSLLVLTAYASGIISLFEVSEYAQMAMPTALAFLLVSLAIVLARPERGPMRLVSSNGAGGELARHLLPAAVGIALVVAALRLLGQMQGLYDTYVGVWMFAIVTVVLITTLMWRFASSYEHAELERKKIEETNRRTIETARDAFISMSSEGLIVDWNSAAEMLFGWSRTQALGAKSRLHHHPARAPPRSSRWDHRVLRRGKGRYSTRRSSSRRCTATDTASRSRPRYGL
ncbi:MAG: PAS domain S-box protein [Actinobacteria bacterium]|nr:PAS domain S-box protein [Actinomycetota bacterium]